MCRYEGEWRDGFAHGLGCYTFANGDIFEGLFFQDKFHGAGFFTPPPLPSEEGTTEMG